jgi:nucleoid-associated protein Lsr2
MAQKVQVLLVDDLDGGEATETVAFGLDGNSYEIDLSSENASKLRKEFAAYVDHARKASGGGGGGRRRRARTGPGRERSSEIRAWAKQRGYKVSERGRIPAQIISEYDAAH